MLNIFPRKKEQPAEAALEPTIELPEPSPEALADDSRKRTRRGTRGGRGRKRAEVTTEAEAEHEVEEAVAAGTPEVEEAEAPAPAPRRRRTRATAEPAAEAATPPAPVEEAPAPRSRRKPARPVAEEAAPEEAPERPARPERERPERAPRQRDGASPDTAAVLRAIEQQNRQIEKLIHLQEDMARRGGGGAVGAPPARVGIFVDAANIELASDRMRARFDWGKILRLLTEGRQLVRATAYSPVHDDPGVSIETQRFVEPFLDKGYKVVTKPLKRFQDGTIKANVDIELALDVITMLDRLDVVVLVSGDGDFQRLVEVVQGRGIRVEVVSVGASTAGNLRNAADQFIDLQSRLRDVRL